MQPKRTTPMKTCKENADNSEYTDAIEWVEGYKHKLETFYKDDVSGSVFISTIERALELSAALHEHKPALEALVEAETYIGNSILDSDNVIELIKGYLGLHPLDNKSANGFVRHLFWLDNATRPALKKILEKM